MNDNQVNSELRLCWLVDEPSEKVQAFWDTLAAASSSLTATRRSRTLIIRLCPTYRRMKAAGWMNIANLDQEHNNIPPDARSILHMVRAHSMDGRSAHASKPPSLQMVLNPYNFFIYNDNYDSRRLSRQFVPFCVPYVVLKEFRMFFNRVAFNTDIFSRAHIASLTEQSLRWMNHSYLSLPYSNGSDRPTLRTSSENFVSCSNNNDAAGSAYHLLDSEAECVICIERILPEQNYVILKCLHPFHAGCIRNWKREKKFEARCPTCRAYIVTMYYHRQS